MTLINSALFMVTWSLTWSCELNWLGELEKCFPSSIFFFSSFILFVAQLIRFRWPGRSTDIVATMKPSLLIRVGGAKMFPCCHYIFVGWRQQKAAVGNVKWGWSYFLAFLLSSGWKLASWKMVGAFGTLPSTFLQCHIQCWSCCEKDWTDLVIKTECPLK